MVEDQIAPLFRSTRSVTDSLISQLMNQLPVDVDMHPSDLPLHNRFIESAKAMQANAYQLARDLHELRNNALRHFLANWEWIRLRDLRGIRTSFQRLAEEDSTAPLGNIDTFKGVLRERPPPFESSDAATLVRTRSRDLPPYHGHTDSTPFEPFPIPENARQESPPPEFNPLTDDAVSILERYLKSLLQEVREFQVLPNQPGDLNSNLYQAMEEAYLSKMRTRILYENEDNQLSAEEKADAKGKKFDEAEPQVRERGGRLVELALKQRERMEGLEDRIIWVRQWIIVAERFKEWQQHAKRLRAEISSQPEEDNIEKRREVRVYAAYIEEAKQYIASQSVHTLHVPAFGVDRSRRVGFCILTREWVEKKTDLDFDDLQDAYLDVDADTPPLSVANDMSDFNGGIEEAQQLQASQQRERDDMIETLTNDDVRAISRRNRERLRRSDPAQRTPRFAGVQQFTARFSHQRSRPERRCSRLDMSGNATDGSDSDPIFGD